MLNQLLLKNIQKYAADNDLVKIVKPICATLNSIVTPQINYGPKHNGEVDALKKDGLLKLGEVLNKAQCGTIEQYFSDKTVSTRKYGEIQKSEAKTKGLKFCNYNEMSVYMNDYFNVIACHPRIINIVSEYLGSLPTIQLLMCRWTLAQDNKPERSQYFHHDYHGIKFVKLFVYLSDVVDDDTAHVFVKKSQNEAYCNQRLKKYYQENPQDKETIRQWLLKKELGGEHELKDDVIYKLFERSQIELVKGGKGFAFLEDTSGMHKGNVPSKDRLFFSAIYTLCDSYKDQKPNQKYPHILSLIKENYQHIYTDEQIKYMYRLIL
jgi:hypothetical protein